ncbi:hypothetical protein HDU93_000808, partial [Gonapodya sp. JEL0774]
LEATIPSADLIQFAKNQPSRIRAAVASGQIPQALLDPITTAYTDSLSVVFKVALGTSGALLLAR